MGAASRVPPTLHGVVFAILCPGPASSLAPASGHHDPAAQHGAGGAAELAQQARLGAAGIGPVAAQAVVVVAGDQKALFGGRPCDHPGKEPEAVAEARFGIGRAGIAKDARAGTAAVGDAIDEL